MNLNIKILGFTLAEVLITIGIIGIVAEITIPAIIMNTQRQEFATLAQKNYSNLQNMFRMYMAEQGVSNLGMTDLYDGTCSASVIQAWNNMASKYFKIAKNCTGDLTDPLCTLTEKSIGTSNTLTFTGAAGWFGFRTSDGITTYVNMACSCTPDFTATGKIKTSCGVVMYDVNGNKGPNIYGKDFFMNFILNYDGTLYPRGGQEFAVWKNDSNQYWRKNSTYCGTPGSTDMTDVIGYGCIARIIENGWRIDYW